MTYFSIFLSCLCLFVLCALRVSAVHFRRSDLLAAPLLWVLCGSDSWCISVRGFLPPPGVFAPLLLCPIGPWTLDFGLLTLDFALSITHRSETPSPDQRPNL